MSPNLTELYTTIDLFWAGKLPDTEKNAFLQHYKADEAFRKEVHFYLSTKKVLQSAADERKAHFDALYEMTNKKPPLRLLKWQNLAAAAIILMILGVGILQFLPPIAEKDAIAQFEPHQKGASAGISTFSIGKKYYDSGDLARAIESLQSIKANESDYMDAQMYIGNIYFKQKKYPQAIAAWQNINDGYNLHETANFNIALAYLAQNDKENAILYLNKVTSKSKNGNKARAILRRLWCEKWKIV